ncbi:MULTISPECIES: retropepsin-like aspartic protease [Sphingobacterium]|uniref:Clan AA aspartic protease n=1 Tax=Sphingobacterium litopenaei TaxID=2763500 RepID=A0ABR7YIG1_9SPHI|nr:MULTISPECIES: retropepsin-like aspartic protease [Sphingobacterium]MBD1430993.1 clan AA aspartic protease [Sphingobacterium litopenaei]NGM74499.1 clan AA aspartic protease [Sphingobacterium sp. SGL-16]
MKIIPFEILTLQQDGYHIILHIELLEKKFKMVLDTGASKTVLDRTTLLEAGIDEQKLIETSILSSGLGTNEMQSAIFILPYLRIGDWECKKFEVAVLDLSTINFAYSQINADPVVGVIGGDILNKYGAVINYKKKTLQLNERASKQK